MDSSNSPAGDARSTPPTDSFNSVNLSTLEIAQNETEQRLASLARDIGLVFESTWERLHFAGEQIAAVVPELVEAKQRLEALPPLGEHGHSGDVARARLEALADRRRICEDWRSTLDFAKNELQEVRALLAKIEEHMRTTTGVDVRSISMREFARVPVDSECDYASDKQSYKGLVVNLGEGGCFLITQDLLPAGTEIDLRFRLPSGRLVRALGKVRWFRDPWDHDHSPGLGVKFTAMGEEDWRALRAFIDENAPLIPPM